ncbi:MAG: YdcF family protein [Polaribacter sp.]|uniref:YdcF family protein n=1 Tax=Polaribacter sp. TaxID=1920175 RepID=UPI002F34F67A
MSKEILIVLGSPNSATGELGVIAKERLNFCLTIYKKEMLILCTGSWGAHFNTSSRPHAFYTKNYLIEKGIPEDRFLELALSKNTVDDAVKIKNIVSTFENIHLTIISSDYHLVRVKLIFKEILKNYKMKFIGVKTNFKTEEYNALVKHEKEAAESIIKNGLYY